MEGLLSKEREFFTKNLNTLRTTYPGRYLLIKGEKVHGAYETHEIGVDIGIRLFGRGPFLVQSVAEPEVESLTVPVLSLGIPLRVDS